MVKGEGTLNWRKEGGPERKAVGRGGELVQSALSPQNCGVGGDSARKNKEQANQRPPEENFRTVSTIL